MTVQVSRVERTLVVAIDRPAHRNAVDPATARRLADAFREFDSESDLDVAVLTGTHGHFCAGADLKAFAGREASAAAAGMMILPACLEYRIFRVLVFHLVWIAFMM